MIKKIKHKFWYVIEVLIISLIIFATISFLSFYLPVIIPNIVFNEIKIGFPISYFHEYQISIFHKDINSIWNFKGLFIDLILSILISLIFVRFIRFKSILKNNILKSFALITFYSTLLFFSISYFGLIKSAIIQDNNYNVGVPFLYYNQFWIGNNFPNHGTMPMNLIIDFTVTWLFTCTITIIFKINNQIKSKANYQN